MGHLGLNNKAPTRMDPIGSVRIPRGNSGLLFSLLAGSALGVTIAGSSKGFEAVFLDLLTISSIILLPICAKRSGYRLALGIAAITIPTSIATLLSPSVYPLISSEGIGIILWGLTQIAIAKFAYTAYKQAQDSKVDLQADRIQYIASIQQADVLREVGHEADIQAGSLSLERACERNLLAP